MVWICLEPSYTQSRRQSKNFGGTAPLPTTVRFHLYADL